MVAEGEFVAGTGLRRAIIREDSDLPDVGPDLAGAIADVATDAAANAALNADERFKSS